jgi:hypothetical protein
MHLTRESLPRRNRVSHSLVRVTSKLRSSPSSLPKLGSNVEAPRSTQETGPITFLSQ